MSPRASDRDACRKSGSILTCYVDGHKRFRIVPLSSGPDDTSAEEETLAVGGRPASLRGVAIDTEVGRLN